MLAVVVVVVVEDVGLLRMLVVVGFEEAPSKK